MSSFASIDLLAASRESQPEAASEVLELSIVLPCLNEADTLETCIRKARRAIDEHGIDGEIIVADNGSSDSSQAIAVSNGARLVAVKERGYGHALMGGIAAARGRYIIMADADNSYDLLEAPKILEVLREGYDLVQGCRLPVGGGRVMPGAMPWLHRWLGNPMLSLMARKMFWVSTHDIYCGMRGFSKALYQRLDLRCTGMEFATEMVIKASLYDELIAEVPITLHPDGRRSHPPHLKTFRDGWRTLRFFLIYSPKWLYFVPGFLLILLGVLGYVLAMPGLSLGGATFDAHTLLFASLSGLLGYQAIIFSIFAKTFAIGEKLLPEDPRLERLFRAVPLERGLMIGAGAFLLGVFLLLYAVRKWQLAAFGPLDYASTMRWVIPGVTLTALGFQTVLSSFFISILGLRRR